MVPSPCPIVGERETVCASLLSKSSRGCLPSSSDPAGLWRTGDHGRSTATKRIRLKTRVHSCGQQRDRGLCHHCRRPTSVGSLPNEGLYDGLASTLKIMSDYRRGGTCRFLVRIERRGRSWNRGLVRMEAGLRRPIWWPSGYFAASIA
jgi:hypothetical protein